jgi:hypothetical protein
LLMLVAGWLQRQHAATIDYLKAENRMLRERLGGRRIVFTDAERRQLAAKATVPGRMALRELGTIVTPDTSLRRHRDLVARKWNFVERRRPGRPRIRKELGPGGAHGYGESDLGLLADPGCDGKPQVQAWPRDDSQDSERPRHRARACAAKECPGQCS